MNRHLRLATAIFGLALYLSACNSTPVRFDTITDLSTIDSSRGRRIKAEAGGFQLLGVIPININSRQERAYQELMDQAGSDAIANVKVSETWAYAVIGTTYWTVLEATAYPLRR